MYTVTIELIEIVVNIYCMLGTSLPPTLNPRSTFGSWLICNCRFICVVMIDNPQLLWKMVRSKMILGLHFLLNFQKTYCDVCAI